jgi:hypothetical protein
MGIIFTPILIIVAGTGFYYFSKKEKKSHSAEAFFEKYSILFRLLTTKRNARVTKMRATSLSLTIKMIKDLHYITLTEVDERLIVVWKLESPLLGKRGKEWSFNPSYDQNRMYEEILTDLRNYQDAIRAEKGFLGGDFTTA